jgi:pimeloyl-ACP methyl ester carboxylesterase
VLFISGGTGDAGHWTTVADILADAYTVITYDRRANSRSPRPPGWTSTTIGEQADDAAALLRGLDQVPAVMFGTSIAAGILADLCLRHPHVLQGAIFHEPAFPSGVPDISAVNAARKARIEEGMASGGPRAAMELYLRGMAGDEVYESLDPQLRERLLGNAEVLFGIELAAYLAYDPAPGQLAAIRVPRAVTAGAGNRDIAAAGHWRYQAAQWLAAHLQTTVIDLPRGAHGLPRPARALRQGTAADTGQAHLIQGISPAYIATRPTRCTAAHTPLGSRRVEKVEWQMMADEDD